MSPGAHRLSFAGVVVMCAMLVPEASARDAGWYPLEVPGGRATLARLGVPVDRERSAVMIDLIRQLHFNTNEPPAVAAALLQLSSRSQDLPSESLVLPSPLPATVWTEVVFDREIPPRQLFVEILNDPHARLLFHGLAGLDAQTRQWFQGQGALLRWLYRQDHAAQSFALFAPGLKVVQGAVAVVGGTEAERRWSDVLDASAALPDEFTRRLFAHNLGRTAGLYFLFTAVDDARRAFLLGLHVPPPTRGRRFERLVASFAACYPSRSTSYPFAVRSHDAALLLAEVGLTSDGRLAGPVGGKFWEQVFVDALPNLPRSSEPVDAAWMVDVLCGAPAEDRATVFATILAAHRVFTDVSDADRADTAEALRARRQYPALFVALEQAGIRPARVYAAAARHARLVTGIDDPERSLTAMRQFQGALMLTLGAATSGSLTAVEAESLIESLSALTVDDGRYDGRIGDWLAMDWMRVVEATLAVDSALSAERLVAAALAGSAVAPARTLHWEGLDYVVDLAGTVERQLLEVRERQGGVLLDHVLALRRIAAELDDPKLPAGRAIALGAELDALAPNLRVPMVAAEYENDSLDVQAVIASAVRELKQSDAASASQALPGVVDFLLAHVLPSWAYAPYLGGADSGALVAGDGSLRHRLGVRAIGRSRAQRWALATSPAGRGSITGSILGVQVGLASWSLRRLSSQAVPAAPAIDSNDLIPLALTVALMNPRHLRDEDLAHLSGAQARGSGIVSRSLSDPGRLDQTAAAASISPWRRAVLPWMVGEEPDRLDEQFGPIERARLGGLSDPGLAAWGSVVTATGSLVPVIPRPLVPELFAGRAADGLVGGRSIDLILRVAANLAELSLPASLAPSVLGFAMRDHLDRVRPLHPADAAAFGRQTRALTRRDVEDYVGAVAAIGPLRPVKP